MEKYSTTKVSAEKSGEEISKICRKFGALKFSKEWDKQGLLVAIRFELRVDGKTLPIYFAADTDALFKSLIQRHYKTERQVLRERAHNIAWRQLKHLVEALLMTTDLGLVEPHHLLLGFVESGPGKTYGQKFDSEFLSLPEGR